MISGIGRRAFTFIELLFIVIIIGVLVAVSLPNLRKSFNSLELNNAAQQMEAVINYTRERAIIEQEPIYFAIDNVNKEYWIKKSGEENRFKTYPFPESIRIEKDIEGEIVFYPDGRIDNVTITLTSADNKAVILTTKGIYGGVKVEGNE